MLLFCINPIIKKISLNSGSKGENFDIKSREVGAAGYQPMLCVFDILYLNGEVLVNRPLRERRSKLADVFNPVEGRLALSDITEKSTKYDAFV
jgi:ATP-dependent DNA ligase